MKHLVRILSGLAFTGSLLLPLAGNTMAAPAAGQYGPGRFARFLNPAYVASVEGVTPATLRQDLQAGQTLFQIAQGRYASAHDLAVALLAPVKGRMDSAVAAGRFTPAQEMQRYVPLLDRVSTLVVTPHPLRGAGPAGQAPRQMRSHVRSLIATTLVTDCNTTREALKAAIHAGGQSPLAVCQSTNPAITQDALVAAITGAVQSKLDAAVSAGRISAARESQLLDGLRARIATLLTTTLPGTGTAPTS